MTRATFATDEQIVGITQDVWSSFTGKAIGSAPEEVALEGGDLTVGCVAVTGDWQGCVLVHTVSLACEGLPLTVSIWRT
jgi:hypothetical protein